jgi:hypothetical protein
MEIELVKRFLIGCQLVTRYGPNLTITRPSFRLFTPLALPKKSESLKLAPRAAVERINNDGDTWRNITIELSVKSSVDFNAYLMN